MKLQFGIIDYVIILVLYALLATLLLVAWFFLRRWRYWRRVIVPIGIVGLALPWAEELWIAWHYSRLCKDAGVYVIRKVAVDGFYDATMRSGYELIERFGYRYMEQPSDTRGKIDHVEKANGHWSKTVLDHPNARYHYKHSYQPRPNVYEEPVGWRLEKKEQVVIDSQSGDILGRATHYTRYPSLITQIWSNRYGSAVTGCDGPLDEPERQMRGLLYQHVLMPLGR